MHAYEKPLHTHTFDFHSTNFIKQIKNDKPVQIYGDGSQTRSFCYIDDMIRGLVAFMNLEENIITPVNIGNPNCEFTMKFKINRKNNFKFSTFNINRKIINMSNIILIKYI